MPTTSRPLGWEPRGDVGYLCAISFSRFWDILSNGRKLGGWLQSGVVGHGDGVLLPQARDARRGPPGYLTGSTRRWRRGRSGQGDAARFGAARLRSDSSGLGETLPGATPCVERGYPRQIGPPVILTMLRVLMRSTSSTPATGYNVP